MCLNDQKIYEIFVDCFVWLIQAKTGNTQNYGKNVPSRPSFSMMIRPIDIEACL